MPAVQFFAKMENNNRQDDGSLAFLQIEPDANNKHFNCSEITQQKLINLSFWVIDFLDDVKTKFGTGRFLVRLSSIKKTRIRTRGSSLPIRRKLNISLGRLKSVTPFRVK